MGSKSISQNFQDLLESISPMLERPAIQRQLIAFIVILLISWILLPFVKRLFNRSLGGEVPDEQGVRETKLPILWRLLRALEEVIFPVVGIVLGTFTLRYFEEQGWLYGLLEQMQRFFLLLLFYRGGGGFLFLLFNEKRAQVYYGRFLKPLFYIVVIIGLNQVLSNVVDLANLPWFTISDKTLTLNSVFGAAVVFYFFLASSWLVNDLLSGLILPRLNIDQGVSNMILTVSHYLIFLSGALISLSMVGIDLSSLAIIGAGLSVGIGFGLQELVANFISGIMLLFEQSIRPGDLIRIDDTFGMVDRLRIRSTTIRTHDNVEIIVPNQSLLTSSVINYTHSDRLVRLFISVGVSYDSDPLEVREALLVAAGQHHHVKSEPPPVVFFIGYGDFSLDFDLTVFVDEIELIPDLRSELRFIIWDELTKRDITIPFPQRDLHIRSGIPWGEENT